MKELVKAKLVGHVVCGRGPRAQYFAACTVKATVNLDKAATKKLGLQSPTVATVDRTSKSGSRDEVGFLHGYTHIPVGMSKSQRRKLMKLDKITLTTKLSVTELETGETKHYTRKLVFK